LINFTVSSRKAAIGRTEINKVAKRIALQIVVNPKLSKFVSSFGLSEVDKY